MRVFFFGQFDSFSEIERVWPVVKAAFIKVVKRVIILYAFIGCSVRFNGDFDEDIYQFCIVDRYLLKRYPVTIRFNNVTSVYHNGVFILNKRAKVRLIYIVIENLLLWRVNSVANKPAS